MEKIKEIIRKFIEKFLFLFGEHMETVFLNEEKWGWLLWIWEKETDYLAWSSWFEWRVRNVEEFNRQPKYEYNQWAQYETRNYCTIYSAVTELSYLFDREFTLCEIKEIWANMIKDGKLDVNKWAYLSDAIDYTRRWWNTKFPDRKVSSFRFSYLEELNRKKFIWLKQLWYRTSKELHNEIQTNWFAAKKDYKKVGWHAVSLYGINIIDNYKWINKHNRYSFQYMKDLIKNWVIFEYWYVFLKD